MHLDVENREGVTYRFKEGWHTPPFGFNAATVDIELLLSFDEEVLQMVCWDLLQQPQFFTNSEEYLATAYSRNPYSLSPLDPGYVAPEYLSEPHKKIYQAVARHHLIIEEIPPTPSDPQNYKHAPRQLTQQDLVALKAVMRANKKSIAKNQEYGGFIYKRNDWPYEGTYDYTSPLSGGLDSFKPERARNLLPEMAEIVGMYHTHGDYTALDKDGKFLTRAPHRVFDGYRSEKFSQDDIDTAVSYAGGNPKFRAYLGTPSNRIWAIDPTTRTYYQLNYISPLNTLDMGLSGEKPF